MSHASSRGETPIAHSVQSPVNSVPRGTGERPQLIWNSADHSWQPYEDLSPYHAFNRDGGEGLSAPRFGTRLHDHGVKPEFAHPGDATAPRYLDRSAQSATFSMIFPMCVPPSISRCAAAASASGKTL